MNKYIITIFCVSEAKLKAEKNKKERERIPWNEETVEVIAFDVSEAEARARIRMNSMGLKDGLCTKVEYVY